MSGLIRSGSLTHFADVARRAGLDPGRMLREFDLPQRCLEDPEVKVPTEAVRRLLEASADRSGVEGSESRTDFCSRGRRARAGGPSQARP